MDYIALYRKYRPQTFDEVVEQTAVVKILKEELKQGKISHAYIFSGPKGSGKTTLARIFAKGLNCVEGPTDKPCLKCANCVAIANGTSLDVIEIDAASNRGIDEIRDLKEKVQYVPVSSKYKVYIIDEAHMLTPQAFNALLKTLEEPPQNVVFILATTEPDKIPQTIASRCERFYFKPISIEGLKQKIKDVVALESATITDDAAFLLARLSGGSLRNALSLLEQVLTVSKDITEETIKNFLDIVDDKYLLDFISAIFNSNTKKIFEVIERLEVDGIDPKIFLSNLIELLSDLISLKIGSSNSVLEKRDEVTLGEMKELLKSVTLRKLVETSKALLDISYQLKLSKNQYFSILIGILDITNALEPIEPKDERVVEHEVEESKPIEERKEETTEKEVHEVKKEIDINTLKAEWNLILNEVKTTSPILVPILAKAEPVSIKGDVVEILPEKPFYLEMLRKKNNLELLESVLKKVTNREFKIVYIEPKEEKKLTKEERIQEVEKKKEIKEILELFEGSITDVKEDKNEKL